MSAKYWIKLYLEILHDRKMATLDDHLWRRIVECFLLAGENDQEGYLPKLDDIAWTLRTGIEELETDLNELVKMGILEYRDSLYFVRKFAERQAPLLKAEYMRRKRNEEQLRDYYQDRYQSVTNSNVEERRGDIEEEERLNNHDYSRLSAAFVNATKIPELTGGVNKWVKALDELGKAGVEEADIENAVTILREKDYSITSLSSIVNAAISEMSKRKGKKVQRAQGISYA